MLGRSVVITYCIRTAIKSYRVFLLIITSFFKFVPYTSFIILPYRNAICKSQKCGSDLDRLNPWTSIVIGWHKIYIYIRYNVVTFYSYVYVFIAIPYEVHDIIDIIIIIIRTYAVHELLTHKITRTYNMYPCAPL